jgi:ribonuclease HI
VVETEFMISALTTGAVKKLLVGDSDLVVHQITEATKTKTKIKIAKDRLFSLI